MVIIDLTRRPNSMASHMMGVELRDVNILTIASIVKPNTSLYDYG